MVIRTLTIFLSLAALTAQTLRANEPVQVDDSAFDVYCPGTLIGRAWTNVDSAMMTDCALLLQHGERSLHRSRQGITADQAYQLAIRMAVQKGDTASLERLAKAAQRDGNKELASLVDSSLKLASASRDSTPAVMVSIDEIEPRELAMLRDVSRRVLQLKIIGDRDELEHWEKEMLLLRGLDDRQKEYLKQIMGSSRNDMPEKPVVDEELQSVLRQLAMRSRPPLDSDDIYRPENDPDAVVVATPPEDTGPGLGRH